jgi:hypothetical protein
MFMPGIAIGDWENVQLVDLGIVIIEVIRPREKAALISWHRWISYLLDIFERLGRNIHLFKRNLEGLFKNVLTLSSGLRSRLR